MVNPVLALNHAGRAGSRIGSGRRGITTIRDISSRGIAITEMRRVWRCMRGPNRDTRPALVPARCGSLRAAMPRFARLPSCHHNVR